VEGSVESRSRFIDVRDKAFAGLEMLREAIRDEQEDYFQVLGRYWQGPTNPSVVPIDGSTERFDPLLSTEGCPSWTEMGLGQPMDVPFSFHCERLSDESRHYFSYSLGTTFVWSDWSGGSSRLMTVTRWVQFDQKEWSDSGWRVFPGDFAEGVASSLDEGSPLPPSWESDR
jgi:hypothetical protein